LPPRLKASRAIAARRRHSARLLMKWVRERLERLRSGFFEKRFSRTIPPNSIRACRRLKPDSFERLERSAAVERLERLEQKSKIVQV
jgi:hypothetical protein